MGSGEGVLYQRGEGGLRLWFGGCKLLWHCQLIGLPWDELGVACECASVSVASDLWVPRADMGYAICYML